MLSIIKDVEETEDVIAMGKMKPLEVAVIVDGDYEGHYVMRTASLDKFEVFSLTNPKEDECWTSANCGIEVRRLNKNESITIKLFNKETEK